MEALITCDIGTDENGQFEVLAKNRTSQVLHVEPEVRPAENGEYEIKVVLKMRVKGAMHGLMFVIDEPLREPGDSEIVFVTNKSA